MKNIKKLAVTLCALTMLLCTAIPVSAAARTYEVTFRAGSKGNIIDKEGQAVTSYTELVEYGGELEESAKYYDGIVEAESGYFFTGWDKAVETKVTGQAVYIAKYTRVINRIDYRINYVDANNTPIATQKVEDTETGVEITRNALEIEGYAADEVSKTFTPTQSGSEITFRYTSTEVPLEPIQNVVTENVDVVVPGPTVVQENVTTIPGATPAATPTPDTVPAPTEPVENEAVPGAGEVPAEDTTTVEDEAVPLAPGAAEAAADDTTTIEDEAVPLANGSASTIPAWAYAGLGGLGIVIIGLGAVIIAKKRKAK